MSTRSHKPAAWAHSNRCTAPRRTRMQGILGRDEVSL